MTLFNGDRRGRGARGPGKRGGALFAPPQVKVDRGALTCDSCNGTGSLTRPVVELDEDGPFDGQDDRLCPHCEGTGTATPK